MKVASIGYQGKKINQLCDALEGAGVKVLIDVRARAWSYRLEYRKNALRMGLEARGIGYLHFKEGGNPYRPPKGAPVDLQKCEDEYRAHLSNNDEIVPKLLVHLQHAPSALFCYEESRRQCHRGVLIEEVLQQRSDIEIIDL